MKTYLENDFPRVFLHQFIELLAILQKHISGRAGYWKSI